MSLPPPPPGQPPSEPEAPVDPPPAIPPPAVPPPAAPPAGWAPQDQTQPYQPAPPDPVQSYSPTPEALPAAPVAKPRSKRPWIVIGAIVLVVVGIVGFTQWQRQQTFDAGHAAYLNADCQVAVDKLGQVSDGDSDMAAQAAAEQDECEDLLAADALADGNAAGAVLAYSDLITKLPESPLVDAAQDKAQALFTERDASDLATTDLCDALEALEKQGLVGSPDTTLPALLIACGNAYEADTRYTDALIVLDRFLTDYADHELAATAKDAFARVTIADAAVTGAGELPAPSAVGDSGEAGDLVKVVIQNDSPNSMSLVFKGPDVRVERLEPCTDCVEFHGTGPDACPEKGPIGEYVMQPGSYDVVVKAADDAGVTPFRGTWELTPGDEFYSCFYLVTE